MSDEDLLEIEPEVREDEPSESAAESRLKLGLPPRTYRHALEGSVAHSIAATPFQDPNAAPFPIWRSLGPRNIGGRVRDLVQDPAAPRTFYAGSAFGGVWRTMDAGRSWVPIGEPQHALPIGALGISADGSILYVGTGEPVSNKPPGRGIFRFRLDPDPAQIAVDRLVGTPPTAEGAAADEGAAVRYARIRVDPRDAERFWVASDTGLWRFEHGTFHRENDEDDEDVTDVDVDFGPLGEDDPQGPAVYKIFHAVRGDGVYRHRFNRAGTTSDSPDKILGLSGRIRISVCASQPQHLHVLDSDGNQLARAVRHSADSGDSWDEGSTLPRTKSEKKKGRGQAYYDLVVSTHPLHPNVVVAGTIDMYRSLDHGKSWVRIIDWTQDDDDPAQHADQHAAVFDLRRPRSASRDRDLWVANDGGVGYSQDLGDSWEKRSYGIIAAQFYDLTVHPNHRYIMGGGLQDNGTFLGYGGKSWYPVFGGDGGMMAFDRADLRRVYVSSQTRIVRMEMSRGFENDRPLLPDLGGNPHTGQLASMRRRRTKLSSGIGEEFKPLGTGVVEHHPTTAGHLLVGRQGKGFVGTQHNDEITFAALDFNPGSKVRVTTVAYDNTRRDTHWWAGTENGRVYRTTDGNGGPWDRQVIPNLAAGDGEQGRYVTRIVVHPSEEERTAVSVSMKARGDDPSDPGRVFLTLDDAAWHDVSGRAPATAAADPRERLPPSPITCLAFHPTQDLLFAGTLAGVYVLDYGPLLANPADPPSWRSFNHGLPLMLVTDLEFSGNVFLRAATFGRGAFEYDFSANAPVEALLSIRQFPTEDALLNPRGGPRLSDPNEPDGDPRTTNNPDAFDPDPTSPDTYAAFDIRVNPPPLLMRTPDGAELDNHLITQPAAVGVTNEVFVQVHNDGRPGATPEQAHVALFALHLGQTSLVPDLQNDFWSLFPQAPSLTGPWSELDSATVEIPAGGQRVVRFEWVPTVAALGRVALLAACSSDPGGANRDELNTNVTAITDLIENERRAALRVVEVPPELYVRDVIDDSGEVGSFAWGGRSPDIIAWRPDNPGDPVPDPAVEFADGLEPAPGMTLATGAHQLFVRVHNRSAREIDGAEVELFASPIARYREWMLQPVLAPGTRTPVATVPAGGFAFSDPIPWTPQVQEDHILVVRLRRPGEELPDLDADPLETFWETFRGARRSALPQDNLAMRVLKFG